MIFLSKGVHADKRIKTLLISPSDLYQKQPIRHSWKCTHPIMWYSLGFFFFFQSTWLLPPSCFTGKRPVSLRCVWALSSRMTSCQGLAMYKVTDDIKRTHWLLGNCLAQHYKYYPGQKIETTVRTGGTGACFLKHTYACSLACVAVSIFLARVVYAAYE